jgi:hypothetical protein
MFKLDNNFLMSLGLSGLPVEEKNKLLQHIYERLEMNVGMRLAEKMTDAQLDEFESFIDRNDESGALRWLETNFPNYKDVVAEELEKLKKEVSDAAPHILSAALSATASGSPAQAVPVQPTYQQQAPNQFQQPSFDNQQQPQPQAQPYAPSQQPMQQPSPEQNPNYQQNQQPWQANTPQPNYPQFPDQQPLPPQPNQ